MRLRREINGGFGEIMCKGEINWWIDQKPNGRGCLGLGFAKNGEGNKIW